MFSLITIAGVVGLSLIALAKLASSKARIWDKKAEAAKAVEHTSSNAAFVILASIFLLVIAVGIGKSGIEAMAKDGVYRLRMVSESEQQHPVAQTEIKTEEDLDRHYMEKQEAYLKSERGKNTNAPKTVESNLLGVIPEADSGSFFGEGGLFEKAEGSIENLIGLDGNFHRVKKN